MRPPADREKVMQQISHFDAIAGEYYAARRAPNHLLLKQLMWRHFFHHCSLPVSASTNVLEAMCGFAEGKSLLEAHLPSRISYSGFDYSGRVIDALRAMHPEINVWHEDVTTFRPTGRQYDIVILLGGLHHVPDHAKTVVAQLASCIKPGGHFISLEPTNGNPFFRLARELIYRRNKIFDAATERAFSHDELMAMFKSAGLTLVESQYPGLLAYVLYYNPDAFPRLNIGGSAAVRTVFALDRLFIRSRIGRLLSFATLSLWRKPP